MRTLLAIFLFSFSMSYSQEDVDPKMFNTQGLNEEMRLKLCDDVTKSHLVPLVQQLYKAPSDAEKLKLNAKLLVLFEQLIDIPGCFDYNFDSVKHDIGVIYSPDNRFRIIHWNIPKSDGTQEYFGFIQSKFMVEKKHGFRKNYTESIQIFPLNDRSSEIKNADNALLDNKKWYGALYNRIIMKKVHSKTYYTLIGWDGNDNFTQKKIIEVLSFDQNGNPKFGADIFNFGKKYPKRVIFEYSTTCKTMPVRYSSKKDTIIFGHLAPTQPQLEGQFQYYCCDLSYDGFGWKKGKWNYDEDVQALNDKDEMDKLYSDPRNNKEIKGQSNTYKDPNHKKREKKKTQ